jgi:GntR family transcriptional regulator, transcriptional repressor for pyruvate dehydrogenase complex
MPTDNLMPIARTTLTADIFRELVSHVIGGVWKPGEKIPPERLLGEKLGVGRASLREALKALEIIGMIETRVGDGTYVCDRSEFLSRPLLWAITSSSESEIHELVEARTSLETQLSELAAERATSEDLRQIGIYLDEMERNVADNEAFRQADIAFHLAIAEAAHNRIFVNALLLIRNLLQQWIGSTLQVEGVAEKALHQHRAIFVAIAKKNPSAARTAMQQHLADMARLFAETKSKRDSGAVSPVLEQA